MRWFVFFLSTGHCNGGVSSECRDLGINTYYYVARMVEFWSIRARQLFVFFCASSSAFIS